MQEALNVENGQQPAKFGRREFMRGILSALGLLLIPDLLPSLVILPPICLDHPLSVGFSFSADEARDFLEQSQPEMLFEDLAKMFKTPQGIRNNRNWVRVGWRQSNSDKQNLKDLDFQYNLADKYNLDVYQIIGADQCFYPNRFPGIPLVSLALVDPAYEDGCIRENERNFSILEKKGFLGQIKYIILGNEPRTVFPDRSIPFTTIRTMQALKQLAGEVKIPTIANDFCSPQTSPQKSWREIQGVADIAALDLYSQTGVRPVDLKNALDNLMLFRDYAKQMIILEGQTRRWNNNVEFTPQDQKQLFYAASLLVEAYGFWEADKLLVFAKRFGNYYGDKDNLKALEDNIEILGEWNRAWLADFLCPV